MKTTKRKYFVGTKKLKNIKLFEEFKFPSEDLEAFVKYCKSDELKMAYSHFVREYKNRDESLTVLDYISFTRNPLLDFHGRNVRIQFDGDGLSNKFHIEPFMYDPDKDPLFGGTTTTSYAERRKLYSKEREERIKKTEIKGVKKYIVEVEVLKPANDKKFFGKMKDIERRLDLLQTENPTIVFNMVDRFKTRTELRLVA